MRGCYPLTASSWAFRPQVEGFQLSVRALSVAHFGTNVAGIYPLHIDTRAVYVCICFYSVVIITQQWKVRLNIASLGALDFGVFSHGDFVYM